MAFRKMMTHHRKSKSIDWTSSKLVVVDVVGRAASGSISESKSTSALCTPPREKKTNKDVKVSKKEKRKAKESAADPQLEQNVRRARSTSPLVDSPSDSPVFIKKPLQGTPNHESHVVRKVDGKSRKLPLLPDGKYDKSISSDYQDATAHKNDEHDGPFVYRERSKSVLHSLTRSQSLEMLSDKHEGYILKAQQGTQDLETLLPPQKIYHRFSSTQDQLKVSDRKKREGVFPKSYHGPWDRNRVEGSPPIFRQQGGIVIAQSMSHRLVQQSRSSEDLLELIEAKIDVNILDNLTGDALLHIIMKKKRKQERLNFLLTLLTHAKVDVNLRNSKGMAALHMAVEEGDEMCVKALVVFGADVNMEGRNHFTPLDLAINNGTIPDIEEMLISLQAKGSAQLIQRFDPQVVRDHVHAIKRRRGPSRDQLQRSATHDRLLDLVNKKNMLKLCRELESNINQRLSFSSSIGDNDDNTVLVMQQREVALFNKTLRKSALHSAIFELEEGSRVLCLDGGGIKGLIQIEVLMQIEEKMKRKITELFDWIVGTSTGGIVALGLVYGGKSLSELRQLYFRIKDEIFSKGRYGFGWDSDAYEEILQQYLDPKMKMMDVTHPRVLIAAVNKATTNLELNFFNNCLEDQYCNYQVWKVARYTSAAPMFLRECDNYVDGGVICNNPTDCGLTVIQNFYRKKGMKPPIALVVSIGSGIFPAEKIGKVDAQAFLYFGKQWLQLNKLMKRTQNLLTLLSQALVESEKVAENSQSRCEEQDIPFYRFNPTLNDIIPAGETDNMKLMDMVIETKIQIKEQRLKEMTELLQMITVSSSDVAVVPLVSPHSSEEAHSYQQETSHIDAKSQAFPVPQVSITIEEEDVSNVVHNEILNKSMVHPAADVDTEDSRMTTSADDFAELDNQMELNNEELPHNHYQLKVDSQLEQDEAAGSSSTP